MTPADIRIYETSEPKIRPIERYMSACVPRVGDFVCVQYWQAEVFRVEWTIIGGKPHADVFCQLPKEGR